MEQDYYVNPSGGVHGNDTFTPIGRIAFVYLAKRNDRFINPRTGKGKFGVTLLIPKDDKDSVAVLEKLKKECSAQRDFFIKKEYGAKKIDFEKFKEKVIGDMSAQPFLRDGDMTEYEGFADHWYIVAKNDENNGTQGINFMDGKVPEDFEPGMRCRLQVAPYVDAKGFSYRLKRIRLIEDDGVRFKTGQGAPDLLSNLDDAVASAKVASKSVQTNGSLAQEFDKALAATSSSAPAGSSLDVL